MQRTPIAIRDSTGCADNAWFVTQLGFRVFVTITQHRMRRRDDVCMDKYGFVRGHYSISAQGPLPSRSSSCKLYGTHDPPPNSWLARHGPPRTSLIEPAVITCIDSYRQGLLGPGSAWDTHSYSNFLLWSSGSWSARYIAQSLMRRGACIERIQS
ncbi:hypothetical protein BC835DRAFT_67354 [Cytidiella melzeri]|nr:hypothetical protein BC835DRAFT_67354 [Cytidiella melzeri]